MKKLIYSVLILAVLLLSFRLSLTSINETERHHFENDNFCESLKIVKWTSLITDEGKDRLGSYYARGFCLPQDLGRAEDLYRPLFPNNPFAMGETFYYDAIEAVRYYERSKTEVKNEVINTLFKKSHALGFIPTEKDLKWLNEANLGDTYKDATR